MRQLVLVDDTVALDNAGLLRRLAGADLPDIPVFVFEMGPKAKAAGDAQALDEPRTWPLEVDVQIFRLGDGRRVIISSQPSGDFPKSVDARTRALFTNCDVVVVRCPSRYFLAAVRFHELSLFALSGDTSQAAATAAIGFLTGMVDRLRNDAARRRRLRYSGGDIAAAPPSPRGELTVLSNAQGGPPEQEGSIFDTRPATFFEDATRLGFEFIDERVRREDGGVVILRGTPGITMFGPYAWLDEGRHQYRLELECIGDGPDAAFTLEAVWGGGANVVAGFAYRFPQPAGRLLAVLDFNVEGPVAGQPMEFRLWNGEDSPELRLTGLELVRVL